ncbi:MAG: nucleoside-diphosphate kinase [Actinomycetota bacterium]
MPYPHDPSKEITLVLVKPDGVRRGLVGEVLTRIERKTLTLAGVKMIELDEALASQHYVAHLEKSFFPELLDFITSGPVVAVAVQGEKAVSIVRGLMGATDPKQAAAGTIRGDFCSVLTENLVHGSDSVDSAEYELGLYFPELLT